MAEYYAKTGDTACICDETETPTIPDGYIAMTGERPTPEHIAQADGTWAIPVKPFADKQAAKLTAAGAEFARRRDEIRWVAGFGWDCAPEDITNFMSAYTPMLIKSMIAPDSGETTIYKIWLTQTEKGLRQFNAAQMTEVYEYVRESQFAAYAWYETVKAQIEAAATAEELAAIEWGA